MDLDKGKNVQQLLEHITEAHSIKSLGLETVVCTISKCEDRSPSTLHKSDSISCDYCARQGRIRCKCSQ